MKEFSTTWKESGKQRKQRKYRSGAPLHIKHKFIHTHLSRELIKKYGKRNTGLRKGDKVRVMKGQFKKHEGKIERVDLLKTRVFVSGVETTRRDGTKKPLPLYPSNLVIIDLNLDDKQRQKPLERK